MRTKTAAAFLAIVSGLTLSACGAEPNQGTPIPLNGSIESEVSVDQFQMKLEDGRVVDCIYAEVHRGGASTGGPSCDWENAK